MHSELSLFIEWIRPIGGIHSQRHSFEHCIQCEWIKCETVGKWNYCRYNEISDEQMAMCDIGAQTFFFNFRMKIFDSSENWMQVLTLLYFMHFCIFKDQFELQVSSTQVTLFTLPVPETKTNLTQSHFMNLWIYIILLWRIKRFACVHTHFPSQLWSFEIQRKYQSIFFTTFNILSRLQ